MEILSRRVLYVQKNSLTTAVDETWILSRLSVGVAICSHLLPHFNDTTQKQKHRIPICSPKWIGSLKARLHRRFLSQQLDAIFVALKLQLQNRRCKPDAICRRDIAGVSNMFET